MLNEGIRTTELELARWVLEPAATDTDVVGAMRLPRGLSVEALLMDEIRAVRPYLEMWSTTSGMDTRELFLRNSTCKRALYLSAPIFLPDTLPVADFLAKGVNTRIHIYHATDVRDTIRLEAVSSYQVGGFRFRYALSIQYAADSVGLGWQIIRPVVVIDKNLLQAARDRGRTAELERLFATLRKLILAGSHDYVHATVLNWFPPVTGVPSEYAAIICERVHPPEVDRWHAGTQTPIPHDLVPGKQAPKIATLELYSLMVHRETIACLWDRDPGVRAHLLGLVQEFESALAAFLAGDVFGPGQAREAADYFTTLVGWFLVSALPLGSERLAEIMKPVPAGRAGRTIEHLAAVHDGMFDFSGLVHHDRFPWLGGLVPVHEVAVEYEAALRWPAIRSHVQYLLRPRKDRRAGSATWLQELCGGQEHAGLSAKLGKLRSGTSPQSLDELRRLGESGLLVKLRAISDADGRRGAGTCPPAILASLVHVIDKIQTAPDRVVPV